MNTAVLAAQLSEAAFARIRSAFPPASIRMFHELTHQANTPEGAEGRRRRVVETFGGGQPLPAHSTESCSICLEQMSKGEVALTLLCGHLFHEACIHEWLGRKDTCPLCKTNVARRPT